MPNRQNVTGEIAPGTKLRHRPELTRSPDNMDPQPPKEEAPAKPADKPADKAADKAEDKGEQAEG